jgi:TRAP-type C4-dicarboxylate transport system permease small subunit
VTVKTIAVVWANAVDRLIGLSTLIGTLALLGVVSIILIDVLGRNLLGHPLSGAQDLSQTGMVLIVFGGMAVCDKLNANVSVDIFEHRFGDTLNHVLDSLGWLIGGALFIAIGVTMIDSAAISRLLNLSTNILSIPKAPLQYAVAGFSFLTAASMLSRLVLTWLTPKHWGLRTPPKRSL